MAVHRALLACRIWSLGLDLYAHQRAAIGVARQAAKRPALIIGDFEVAVGRSVIACGRASSRIN